MITDQPPSSATDAKNPADPTAVEQFSGSGLRDFTPYLMNRIMSRYNAEVASQVRDQGLNVPRLRILAALAAEGSQSVNNLAVFAVSEQSTVSRLIDTMELEGLVTRSVSKRDNRSRIIALTDEGMATFARCFPIMRAGEAAILAGFSPAECALVRELLGRMLDNVRETPI